MLSILIVSYQSRDMLAKCLDSLSANPPDCAWEIVVADNASTDGSVELLRERYPHIQLIINRDNVGFARAANQACAASKGEQVCFLNSDTEVEPGAMARMSALLSDNSRVGAVGPQMRLLTGTPIFSAFRFPTLTRPLFDLAWVRGMIPTEKRKLVYEGWDFSAVREVDWISGACLMTRRALLDRVGLFDERFFMYFEDVDLCLRIRRAGYSIYYLGDAVVVHRTRGSTAGTLTPTLFLTEQRSRLLFFIKHYGFWGGLVIRACMAAGALWRIAALVFRRSKRRAHNTLAVNLRIVREALFPVGAER